MPTDEGNNLLSHSIPDATKSETGLARLPDDNGSSTTGNAPTVTVGATGLGVPHEADLGSGTTNATAEGAWFISLYILSVLLFIRALGCGLLRLRFSVD